MRKILTYIGLWAFLFAAPVLSGCAEEETEEGALETETGELGAAEGQMGTAEATEAVAMLQPTEGNEAQGTVTFTEADGAVRVVADLTGLAPGEHGIHVHEVGDCSAPDASSAGGHFNPMGSPHGAPTDPPSQRHVGDLGNLETGPEGAARFETTDSLLAFDGETGIVGRAVVVHSGPDDFTSQPSGDAGTRVACGVIELQNGAGAAPTTAPSP